jgi:hypothetical protein
MCSYTGLLLLVAQMDVGNFEPRKVVITMAKGLCN